MALNRAPTCGEAKDPGPRSARACTGAGLEGAVLLALCCAVLTRAAEEERLWRGLLGLWGRP